MFTKWYLGLCICISIFLGIFDYASTSANQELVLHINNTNISSVESRQTITKLKQRLKDFGVAIVKIENQNNRIRIQYYSASALADIEAFFNSSFFDFSKLTKEKERTSNSLEYEGLSIDFSEIQQDGTPNQGINGVQVETHHSKTDRLSFTKINGFNHNYFLLSSQYYFQNEKQISFKNTLKCTFSFKIPQSRAGPHLNFLS